MEDWRFFVLRSMIETAKWPGPRPDGGVNRLAGHWRGWRCRDGGEEYQNLWPRGDDCPFVWEVKFLSRDEELFSQYTKTMCIVYLAAWRIVFSV
jgi:hypothetical protein